MDRRGFLRAIGLGVAAAAAPTKAYSFLGGILRPRSRITGADGYNILYVAEPTLCSSNMTITNAWSVYIDAVMFRLQKMHLPKEVMATQLELINEFNEKHRIV